MVEGERVDFEFTISSDDVNCVMEALMKRFKSGEDEPVKTVFLAILVAEIEVLLYKRLMSDYCTNLDEVIADIRLKAKERASYMYKH